MISFSPVYRSLPYGYLIDDLVFEHVVQIVFNLTELDIVDAFRCVAVSINENNKERYLEPLTLLVQDIVNSAFAGFFLILVPPYSVRLFLPQV